MKKQPHKRALSDKALVITLLSVVVFLFFANPSVAQLDTLTVATYNVLKFPSEDGTSRIPYFRKVIDAIDPDILVIQELESNQGQATFLNEIMNYDGDNYLAASFVDGPDTDSGFFYRGNKVTLFGVNSIQTDLRNINEYFLLAFGQDFTLYSLHLKAGSTDTDQNRRLTETTVLRDHLNDLLGNSKFIVAGDYNIRSASEEAFVELTEEQADNDGRLFDPISLSGDWHNNQFFALIHTQSTRVSSFGGGATGGLDDRFDMMLVSESLLDGESFMRIVPESYKAFGNDGNRFNQSVIFGQNFAVPDSIAEALHQASDHLPVVADYVFGIATSVDEAPSGEPSSFALYQNYPNPFNPVTTLRYVISRSGHVTLSIHNVRGEEIERLVDAFHEAGEHTVTFNGSGLPSGVYFYSLLQGRQRDTRKFLLLK